MKFIKLEDGNYADFDDITELKVLQCNECDRWHVVGIDSQKQARLSLADFEKQKEAQRYLDKLSARLNATTYLNEAKDYIAVVAEQVIEEKYGNREV